MAQVRGYFTDGARRPYVGAEIVLPRLGVWGEVELLVDTGSDSTILHWGDRLRLQTPDGLPLPANTIFSDGSEASGIAGSHVPYGSENAVLFFDAEDGSQIAIRVRVDIELTPPIAGVPSLLGRDVLSEARLDFNMPADELVLDWALG